MLRSLSKKSLKMIVKLLSGEIKISIISLYASHFLGR
jgi:hypothetical protein